MHRASPRRSGRAARSSSCGETVQLPTAEHDDLLHPARCRVASSSSASAPPGSAHCSLLTGHPRVTFRVTVVRLARGEELCEQMALIKSSGWPPDAACQKCRRHHRHGSIQMRNTNSAIEALLASICGAPGNIGAIHKWRDCEDRNHRTLRSLWFDVCCSDYLGPFFGIIRNELSEFGR